jgi:CRP-like cAMP-binding protein
MVLEGNAKMFMEGINKRNIILNILMPSKYIGLIAVFGLDEYNYSVAALGSCLTCHIDINLVKKMYYSNNNFMLKLNKAFGQSVSSIMGKLVSLNQNQIRGKVAGSLIYLSQLYDDTKFVLDITRRELGELSAISEENAVRCLQSSEMKE